MSKRNAARLSLLASLYALVALAGVKYAQAEQELHSKSMTRRGHSHYTRGTPGAFGGSGRTGVKLIRSMMRKPENKSWAKTHPIKRVGNGANRGKSSTYLKEILA